MPYRSRYDKRDANEKEIVKKLQSIPGIGVQVGHDDLLIGFRGRNYWIELKNPERVSSKTGKEHRRGKSKTQQRQDALSEGWPGQYSICSTFEEIIEVIGI